MSLSKIVDLKRTALQTRIDALTAREIVLQRKLNELGAQGDGALEQAGGFQRAAMARRTTQAVMIRLETECQQLKVQREALLRERLSLDIAAKTLAKDLLARQRLEERRADLKG